ncbi:MAG: AbrB/MazE/SpoVT family DNA-binding domain-containing protein [Verrucomicrobiota bacterium]
MNAIVSEKGQVTIPKQLRLQLGLESGSVLEFEENGGTLVARKKIESDRLADWIGAGALPDGASSVDDYLSSLRSR